MTARPDPDMNDPMELGPRYRYIRQLGTEGSGRVLLVRDTYLRKTLALKLHSKRLRSAGDLAQVKKEFALLSELEHPRVARVHDFGFRDGRPCFKNDVLKERHGWAE